jgi:hypothetical protein
MPPSIAPNSETRPEIFSVSPSLGLQSLVSGSPPLVCINVYKPAEYTVTPTSTVTHEGT